MSQPVEVRFQEVDLAGISSLTGRIALICDGDKPTVPRRGR
jgi:hypothetical protein